MLFKEIHLKGIREGSISLAFRNWKKPMVKPGSLVKTSIGLVEITQVSVIQESDITPEDAYQAGFHGRNELLGMLHAYPAETIYRIELRYHSADPRLALRAQDTLNEEEFRLLQQKLVRLESKEKWTREVLQAIGQHPLLRAADLAGILKREKEWLKIHIRKLKTLGLTISHDTGYELSARGKAYLSYPE